ncbi:kinesin light chain-like protein [Candidatus Vecturithrix granuli]|uniref:Kinesin light chain-like protein n=1 Tax=Vecturithrix granuli TaxID=1499967 RepID=A0A081C6I6_VECG1|nr:kinesin light chain-like protein [Candidatus Vecturithrix granuli]
MKKIIGAIFVLLLVGLLQNGWAQQAPEDELAQAKQLNQQVIRLYQQGQYAEAIPLAEQELAIREKASGPEHPDTATSLNNLAVLYKTMGNYAQAEPLYQRALVIREKALGAEHPDTAQSLNSLATLYYGMGDYAQAESLYQSVLAIRKKVLGPEHPAIATSLNNLAVLYQTMGDYAQAKPLLQRALTILEKVLGPEHPDTATSLSNLAALYYDMGDYAQAEPLYQRALTILEKVLGPEHPDIATSLNNLAALYRAMGDYVQAEPLYQRALTILEKVLGPEHPNVATNLNNLAELYRDMGAYAQAEPLYQRALTIREKVLGPEHPAIATSLNNLAALYDAMGDYAQAEPLYQRALTILEKALGPEHPNVATSLNNLAVLYGKMGDYAQAEPLLQRVLAIWEKALGPEHPDVASSLNNLALLYHNMGIYAQAEPLYQRALTIDEKVLGPEHPNVAIDLNNLAELYRDMGAYAQAEPLYQRALTIREQVLGPEHPVVAANLNNLAELYRNMGAYAQAEPLYQRALTILEKALGPEHPDTATSLGNLAGLVAAQAQYPQAYECFKRAQQISDKLIDQIMSFTSESQKLAFLATQQGNLNGFLSLLMQHLAQDAAARKDGLEVWLRRKGVILEVQKRFQEALLLSDAPEVLKIFEELSQVRAQLSQRFFAGPGKESFEAYKQQLDDLKQQKDALEAKLSRQSQAFAASRKVAQADVAAVAAALPQDTVLLEFARIDLFNFSAKGQEPKWLPAHYLAFILHAGDVEHVQLIDLGDAQTIDNEIARLRRFMETRDNQAMTVATHLYDLVFAPLQQALGAVQEVFISPDGNLNLIPFEVLLDHDGNYLIEQYQFLYLAAGRDVVGFGQAHGQSQPPLLMGDPDFDFVPTPGPSQEGNYSRSADMRGLHFKRLPGTRIEVETIHGLLADTQPQLYTDQQAREAALIGAQAPRILHLATHGFFLEDQELPYDESWQRRTVIFYDGTSQPVKPIAPGKFENPLLRSGIVLSGANKSFEDEQDEGIITAEKILGLKLRGTDMVVLSACETGLGDVQIGEGVYGLRRTFMQVGAKSLVMSLWSVPDQETQELMVQFYKNILSGKMNRCQALRQAALQQMQIVKERYDSPHPFYWGAFVFLGEP